MAVAVGVCVAVAEPVGVKVSVMLGVLDFVRVAEAVRVGRVPVGVIEGVTTPVKVSDGVAVAEGASVGMSEAVGVHEGVPTAPNSDS
jgi:hypothetical protein